MDSKKWDRFAPFYDLSRKPDRKAYERMYAMMRPVVKGKPVLELATGTGLIAKNIADAAKKIIATDFSPKMIAQAKKRDVPDNVSFIVQDACDISFPDDEFDVVIISNALHVMPQPETALAEIRRVLKPGGVLIAPTYTHAKMNRRRKALSRFLKAVGFKAEHKWSSKEYASFLESNGWRITRAEVAHASFPLTYIECIPDGG